MRKARALSDILTAHEGPLTADFQRVYGLRLVSAVTDRDESELLDLVQWLPRGSATHAAIEARGDGSKARALFGWTPVEDLTLGLVNLIAHQTYVLAQVNSPKKIQAPQPVPGPRGSTPNGPKRSDASAIARGLLAQAQKGG